jgi:hypothetical protein
MRETYTYEESKFGKEERRFDATGPFARCKPGQAWPWPGASQAGKVQKPKPKQESVAAQAQVRC